MSPETTPTASADELPVGPTAEAVSDAWRSVSIAELSRPRRSSDSGSF